jgi:hypothetical protein
MSGRRGAVTDTGSATIVRPGRGKVLVVGMDGVRYDRLARSSATAPVLHGLMATGAHGSGLLPYGEVDGQAEGGPSTSMAYTDSGPGWSSVLTGVWPDRHGVTGNDFEGADYVRHPDFLSRAAAARPGLRTAAAVSWPELIDRGTLGPGVGERARYDGESDGYEQADRLVADTAVRWLSEGDPDALFVYFGATDEAGHATGPLGPAYDRALLAQDAHLGRLLDAIAARRRDPARADERWTVLVTTDHGHLDTGGHGGDTHAEREIFVVLAELGTGVGPGAAAEPARAVEPGTADAGSAGRASGKPGTDGPADQDGPGGPGDPDRPGDPDGAPGANSTGSAHSPDGTHSPDGADSTGGTATAHSLSGTHGPSPTHSTHSTHSTADAHNIGGTHSPHSVTGTYSPGRTAGADGGPRTPRTPGGTPLGSPALVDIAPTVLDRLGVRVDPDWGLAGRVLPRPAAAPSPSLTPPPTPERS